MANDLTTKVEALAVRVEYRDGKPVDYVRKDEVLAALAAPRCGGPGGAHRFMYFGDLKARRCADCSEIEAHATSGCARCVTPKKCAAHGCCPGTWPAEAPNA